MIETHQVIGNLPGWVLTAHMSGDSTRVVTTGPGVRTFSSADYDAEIHVTCPMGLGGGTFEMTIPGFTDDDYQFLKGVSTLRLYLFWKDTNSSFAAYLASLAGLSSIASPSSEFNVTSPFFVTELAITAVKRRAGVNRYETIINGCSSIHHTLQKMVGDDLANAARPQSRIGAISAILAHHEIPFELAAPSLPSAPPTSEEFLAEVNSTHSCLAVINALIGSERRQLNKYGRGLLLSRNGAVIIGPRLILDSERSHEITAESGLIQITAGGTRPRLLNPPEDDNTPERKVFTLLVKGRSDINVGDTVTFAAPLGEKLGDTGGNGWGALGNLAEALTSDFGAEPVIDTTAYVEEIEHRMGRKTGYSTIISVVTLNPADGEEGAWDTFHRDQPDPEQSSPTENAGAPTTETGAASSAPIALGRAMDARIRQFMASRALDDVGEIRVSNADHTGDDVHTSYIWMGADGAPPNQAIIARPPPSKLWSVPYITPFSWGYCGLMLPRFPGGKVLLTHRLSRSDHPIDLGSIHENTLGPQGTEPGDWWLSLPLFSADEEPGVPDDDEIPEIFTGKITQDLTNTKGQRFIEVGELTIRVGEESLKEAGSSMRPDPSETANSITIVHTKNATKIVVDQDGKVTITAKEIEMNSEGNIALNAVGDVNIDASNVNVSVSGKMDIS